MASAAEETDSAILLILSAIRRLRAKAPEHELLKFAGTFGGCPPEFLALFGGEHVPVWARGGEFALACVYKNYWDAIERALQA